MMWVILGLGLFLAVLEFIGILIAYNGGYISDDAFEVIANCYYMEGML